jgi:hypothetical protein
MDPSVLLSVVVRWLHITSAVVIVGGAIHARYFALAGKPVPGAAQRVLLALIVMLGSGIFQLINRMPVPVYYHMIFGVKFLLFLHVGVVTLLVNRPGVNEAKRHRMLAGVAISGVTVILISAFLRTIQ